MADPAKGGAKRGILSYFSTTTRSEKAMSGTQLPEELITDVKKIQKRSFQEHWKQSYSWLMYDRESNLMKCKYCSESVSAAKTGSKFISGCSQFKKESVKKHNDSTAHKVAAEHFLSKRKPKQIVSSFKTQCMKADEKPVNELKIKFNTAYGIAKEELPFTKFRMLLQVQRKNGLLMNEMYENDIKCAEIIHCISATLKDKLVNHLRDSQFFSVLIDAATDTSNKENEAVVVRYVSHEGIPETKVLGVIELQHADAEGTLDAIKEAFLSADEELSYWNHLVGFCSDGASVNFGTRSGVAKRLTDDCPWLIPVWCLPHRLELAVMDMLKKSDMGAKVIDVLHLIYKTYHYSPKSRRELQTLADSLQVRIKSPSRVKGTRWSPHTEKALRNLLLPQKGKTNEDEGQYSIVYQHMEHLAETSTNADIKGRAKYLTKIMKSFKFVAFCHLLLDILKIVSSLSFSLQANKTILTTSTSAIRSCMADLSTLKTQPLPGGALIDFMGFLKVQCVDQFLHSVKFQLIALEEVPEIGADHDSSYDSFSLAFRRTCVNESLSLVIDGMKNRYRSIVGEDNQYDEPSNVVKAMKVFHHDSWPESDADLALYGDTAISDLVRWFEDILHRNGCKIQAVLSEWKSMKMLVKGEFADKTFTSLWKLFLTKEPYSDMYQNVLMLVKIMLCLSVSSAQCERTFSAMNRIKSDVRSSLNVTTLEDLIRISGEGPDIMDYDPKAAVQKSTPRKVKLNYSGWPDDFQFDDTTE